jgi:hypothetical protein
MIALVWDYYRWSQAAASGCRGLKPSLVAAPPLVLSVCILPDFGYDGTARE